jgi:TonB-linked SusC/RagA family outer membrane protein
LNATISGGNANTQFLIGAGYNGQTTVFPGDYGDKRGSMHFSLTSSSPNQKFRSTLTGSYAYEHNDVPAADFTASIVLPPDSPPLYKQDGTLNFATYNGSGTFYNPLTSTVVSYNSNVNNLVANLKLSYQFLPNLVLSSNFGYNNNEMGQIQLTPATLYPPPGNTNPNSRRNESGNTFSNGWVVEPQLNFTKKISKGQINVLIGSTVQQTTVQAQGSLAYGFASDALISNPLAASYFQPEGYDYALYRYEALLARVGYIWDEKYILNLTGNREGSSRFGPGKQYGNFGAIGFGWILSKEKIVQDAAPWLSFGKLRGSYGTTGNAQIGDYQYLSTYLSNSNSYQGLNELYPRGLTNPYYAWETDKKLEAGIELGFLKDRIDLSTSYYRNRTGNQLTFYPLPQITGFIRILENIPAVIQNTGLEAALHTVNIKASSFTWTTSLNFTFPQNKLVSYQGFAESGYEYAHTVGKSLFSEKLYQYTGLNQQTGVYSIATQNTNGNPLFPQDLVVTAPVTQKYFGGMQNSFSYKGFSIDVFIQFVKQLGNNYQSYFLPPGASQFNQPTAVLNAWSTPGRQATIERFSTGVGAAFGAYENFTQSTGILTDASFIKLKNLSLSYNLPATWQKKVNMQNARVYIQGQNLFTLTHYIGLDPETQGLGLPPLRVITIGISASF